ncbi:MAG: hypothetical protein ACR2OO_04000 [Thermomicrobiales bacterium]
MSETARPLRFVIFGESIVSDWRNPMATSARAIQRALVRLGHDVLFLERRRNEATLGLLRARGSAPLRAFDLRFPDLQHRTYDLPNGWERSVWFAREAGTADAIVTLPGAPPEVMEQIAGFDSRYIVRLIDTDVGLLPGTFPLHRAGDDGEGLAWGPTVEIDQSPATHPRSGLVVVRYEEGDLDPIAEILRPLGPTVVDLGGGVKSGVVAEADLPDLYRASRVALLLGVGSSPYALARALLPLAAGCRVLVMPETFPVVGPTLDSIVVTSMDELHRQASDLLAEPGAAPALPARFDAARQAATIAAAVRKAVDEGRRGERFSDASAAHPVRNGRGEDQTPPDPPNKAP